MFTLVSCTPAASGQDALLITEGLGLRLDAGDLTGLSEGDPVALWPDRSGLGLDATAGNGTSPSYRSNAINGRPVVHFDGNDAWMSVGTIRDALGGYEAFVVSEGQDATGQNWQRLLSAWDGGTADDWMPPSWNVMRPHDATTGQPVVYEPAIQHRSGSQATPIRNVMIARSGIGVWQLLAGDIAEILVYDRQLSSYERNKAGYYLQTKYGTSDGYTEPLTPTIRSATATLISLSSATLNGTLAFTGPTPSQVRVYWGSTDGATSAGAWEASIDLGMSTLSTPETFSVEITGLVADTTYFYRFHAQNESGAEWAATSGQFSTSLPSVSANDAWAAESSGSIEASLTLSKSWGESVSVRYTTADGTAAAPEDYASSSVIVSMAPGQTELPIAITLKEDELAEGVETFVVHLSDPVNAVLGNGTGTCRIYEPMSAFHVAVDGDDQHSGDLLRPFATLERARDAIREMRTAVGMTPGGVTVFVRGGEYPRERTFVLDREDSGEPDAPIVYSAFPGEDAMLSGRTCLPKAWFSPVTDPAVLNRVIDAGARANLMQADLATHGVVDVGQIQRRGYSHESFPGRGAPEVELRIDGERMVLARWPNASRVKWETIIDPGPVAGDADYYDRGGVFSYAFSRPEYWTYAQDIWLDGIVSYPWEWTYNRVASIDTNAQTIHLRYGDIAGLKETWGDEGFHFENLLEEIDLPGEYFIDRTAGILYLLPTTAFDAAAPVIALTTLDETFIEMNSVSHVIFRDLTLDSNRGGAITGSGGTGNRFEGLEVRYVMDDAVVLENAVDTLVAYCTIHDVGSRAVALGGGDMTTLDAGHNAIEDTLFHDFAYWDRAYHPAVWLGGVANRVSHCEFHDGPHAAITFNGNDHLIEKCEFHHVVREFQDFGAIYAYLGIYLFQRGHVIRNNYFHDIGYDADQKHRQGVYPDGQSMGWLIEGNVFYRMGGADGAKAIQNNTGGHIMARGNVFIDCPTVYEMTTWGGDHHYAVDNLPRWTSLMPPGTDPPEPHATRYPELWTFWDENQQYPTTSVFKCNLMVNGDAVKDATSLIHVEDNYSTTNDPGFVDMAGGGFTLREDSDVFGLLPCFEGIAFGDIGIRDRSQPWSTFQSVIRSTNQAFEVQFFGGPYWDYRVWASSNLLNWNVLGYAEEVSPGVFRYMDRGEVDRPRRFYKAGAP